MNTVPEKTLLNKMNLIANEMTKNNNQNTYIILTIILIIYCVFFVSKIPCNIIKIINHPFAKIIILSLIAYISIENPMTSIMCAIAFIMSLQTFDKKKTNKYILKIIDKISKKKLEKYDNTNKVEHMTNDIQQVAENQNINNQNNNIESNTTIKLNNVNCNDNNINMNNNDMQIQQNNIEHKQNEPFAFNDDNVNFASIE
jgi:hypothetical protein